ncbi:MAG: flagellar motor switch protein FliG [Desulfobacteraceae bacterium]|nr:MAG: flagellar motor switch protein FliG [Desulfobacteraceae bacterium]
MDSKKLPGSLKAAILIQSLGGQVSQEILDRLDPGERGLIKGHLSQMGPIPEYLAEKVAEEFTALASKEGEQELPIDSNTQSSALKAIQSMDPDLLSKLTKDEHPQTIAIILAHLEPHLGSRVLAKLPDETKSDVAVRIANLGKVSSGMVEEINKAFETILKENQSSNIRKIGGISQVADILNQTEGTSTQLILDGIEKTDPDLAAEIKQQMFVFEDLTLIDDRGLQKVLRSVETKELAIALKAGSEEVKQKIFRNMSERAGQMLKEEVDEMGPVRIKEVEDAQQTVTRIIQNLEEKGELIISGRGGEEFI